jgi:1,4-dihydroxy-2-naphthoate polyprenyltransferase
MHYLKALATLRPPFLLLTPICVGLGFALAMSTTMQIDYHLLALVLLGALCAHISVNTLNEYHDFKSGLDLETQKTAFSGGSGALPANPDLAHVTLSIGLGSLIVTTLIGCYFVVILGAQIIPFGVLGIVVILTYTQWLNRNPLLCLIASGLGFGFLMVVGTYVVLSAGHNQFAWLVALVPFFLVNNLLLLNQYPDIEADAKVGRRTFPIVFGIKVSNWVYAGFMLAAYGVILLLVLTAALPYLSLIAILPMILTGIALKGAINYGANIGQVPQFMAANVAATLLTPLLLSIAIIWG